MRICKHFLREMTTHTTETICEDIVDLGEKIKGKITSQEYIDFMALGSKVHSMDLKEVDVSTALNHIIENVDGEAQTRIRELQLHKNELIKRLKNTREEVKKLKDEMRRFKISDYLAIIIEIGVAYYLYKL